MTSYSDSLRKGTRSRKVKDLPPDDRPREKLKKLGVRALSNLELLAVILGKGTKGKGVFQLAADVLVMAERNFENIEYSTLTGIVGMGPARSSQVIAAIEFSRRFLQKVEGKIQNATDVLTLVTDLKEKKQEHFVTLTLDGAANLIQKKVVFIGTLNQSLVHPREVFVDAILDRAAGIICVHNHPSGNIQPSRDDIAVTRRLVEAGKIIGIRVIDHIIVGKNSYFSFQGEGILNSEE